MVGSEARRGEKSPQDPKQNSERKKHLNQVASDTCMERDKVRFYLGGESRRMEEEMKFGSMRSCKGGQVYGWERE